MISLTGHYNAISIDRHGDKVHGALIILFYVSLSPPLVLKRMLRYSLKPPPLKKILQFQDRICFFLLKPQKNLHSSASDWW